MIRLQTLIMGVALAAACGGDDTTRPDAEPVRIVDSTAMVGVDGRSDPVAFVVPPGSRSIAIIVEGAPTALFALAELTLADGVDLVQLPAGSPGPAMQASYRDEQIGQMPGALYQSIRLGAFSHVHPNRPDQAIVPGSAILRVASDTVGEVAIRIIMVADDGSATLRINTVVVSGTLALGDPPAFVAGVATFLSSTGIVVEAGRTIAFGDHPLAAITDFNEPQESPGSQSAMLPALVAAELAGTDGIDVFIVDSLPAGVAGLSLGTPGPPERGSSGDYYFGVVIASSGTVSSRVVAHEVCHFLGLQHVQNVGVSGAIYPDPLDDTELGSANLMESGSGGTTITADQAFVLQRSPLLR